MTRLEIAAAHIDHLISVASTDPESDQEMIARARQAAATLRETTRKDLDKAVWASVFYCLKIKNLTWLSNELQDARI